jgi:hypothetical protein
MVVNCSKWRDLASEYIEEALSEPMMTAVREHLESCATCRDDEAVLRSVLTELNTLPEVEPPMFFHENVMAAVQRAKTEQEEGKWWKVLLPKIARTAVGTLVAGGAAAAFVFAVLLPRMENNTATLAAQPAMNFLPGTTTETGSAKEPQLRISRRTIELEGRGPTYSLMFWLENSERGTARFDITGVKEPFRFNLTQNQRETLQIPFDVVTKQDTLEVRVAWTGDGKAHTRHIFLPIPNATEPAGERQAFQLTSRSLIGIAQELSDRYDVPITLDDVQGETTAIAVSAQNETAEEVLRRSLNPLGFHVASSRAGILVHPRSGGDSEPEPRNGATDTPLLEGVR